ncbi:MAG: glutamine amidotransferase family protein [Bacteroides sp.]|nr:glutamine amidotransferase family protein [Prevotella sp.]MCM1408098.1 glutamine amidotransferase family protein [Treponema brennaborense]MCM1469074.1 glutamine amidotransferase family protein [Bacteroides sp.]
MKEGEIRIPSGCAISGIFSRKGKRMTGENIVKSIETMHDRSNGLGGGFAGYGIYPEYKQYYAFHIFYESVEAKRECEIFIEDHFDIINLSKIPVRKNPAIRDEPLIWRYFVAPLPTKLDASHLDEKEFTVRCVNKINTNIQGAYVFSSGKNMGVFKAVGFPEDVGRFYRLDEYAGYCWTAHGRYPTNTPGWWGGAHPFALLDYTVVHNGEISSYDANRRFIEMFGYKCNLLTDTEVITYILDYLVRKQSLSLEETAHVIAAPFWQTIDNLYAENSADSRSRAEQLEFLRRQFPELLITGPFSILFGFTGGMMALNDRLKLRSMVCAEKDDLVYMASEECAIRVIENNVDRVWSPKGGEPVIVTLDSDGLAAVENDGRGIGAAMGVR